MNDQQIITQLEEIMKNTLKKVISIILAAVLLCAPVAVVAENVEDAWDVGENYVYSPCN